MFDNGFDRERAGDFAMGFAAHPVRAHIEVQRRDDAVAVFVIGAHHAHVRGATGRDWQVHSPWEADGDNSASTRTGSQNSRYQRRVERERTCVLLITH